MHQHVTKSAEAIIKHFEPLSMKWRMDTVFSDWLTICTCMFANQTAEDLYLETIKKYEREELTTFAKGFAMMVNAYDEGIKKSDWVDVLGHCQEIISSSGHKSSFGQFFTPTGLCDLMAKQTIGQSSFAGAVVGDCACGSGRTLLAAAFSSETPHLTLLHGTDLDARVCQMAAVNLLMHNLEGLIIRRNALSLETFGGFYVHRHGVPYIQHLTASECNDAEAYLSKRSSSIKGVAGSKMNKVFSKLLEVTA